jgi:hypothetical protein
VVNEFQFQGFQVLPFGLDFEHAFALKHKVQATGGAHASAGSVKVHADVGDGAGGVVGSRFDHNGHSM